MDRSMLLAAGLAVTFALVRFLKSDTVNEVLASKGFPPINPRALPFLSGFFGLAYAILLELQTRGVEAWREALLFGVLEGLGLGGAASYIHDLGKGVPGVKKVLGIGFVVFSFSGVTACKPAEAPRENARAVVLIVADGVRAGDLACASVADAKHDLTLAEGCAAAVRDAREALIAAEDGVDAWDLAAIGKVPCATSKAVDSLQRLLGLLERAGGKRPPVVDDALRFAGPFLGGCRG